MTGLAPAAADRKVRQSMKHRSLNFELATEYGLSPYPCGACCGDKMQIKIPIVVRDHRGKPTGKIHPKGEVWTVLSGVKKEPDVIWLRDTAGDRHTWDAASFFEALERIEKNAYESSQPPLPEGRRG